MESDVVILRVTARGSFNCKRGFERPTLADAILVWRFARRLMSTVHPLVEMTVRSTADRSCNLMRKVMANLNKIVKTQFF
jgi:hypothetical protein